MRKSDLIKGSFENFKYSTHDKDIGTSKHDEIVLWLYEKLKNQGNIAYFFGKIEHKELNINNYTVESWTIDMERPILKAPPPYRHHEAPSIAGYWDLSCNIKLMRKHATKDKESILADYKRWGNKDIPSEEYIQATIEESRIGNIRLNIEVKTNLNVGEVIRQIRFYESVDQYRWPQVSYVCAPPSNYSSVLKEQGIEFISYVPKALKNPTDQ